MLKNSVLLALLALAGCTSPSTVSPARPTSDFPVSFIGSSDAFYAERLVFTLGWSADEGGYGGLSARYMWAEPGVGVGTRGGDLAASIWEEPTVVDGRLLVVMSEETESLLGLSSAELFISPDGTIEGTMVGDEFVRPYGVEPTPTEVEVSGPLTLSCALGGAAPELELANGSRAVFDCSTPVATFTIEP